jgi:hypothetical protein
MYKTAQNSNSTNHRQIGVENHTTNSLLQSELTRTRKLRASRRLHYKIKFEIEEYYHEFRVFRVWSFEDKKRGKRKNGWTRFPRCVVQHESLSFLLKPSDICTFTYHISGIDYHFVLSFREWYVDTRGINLLWCGFETRNSNLVDIEHIRPHGPTLCFFVAVTFGLNWCVYLTHCLLLNVLLSWGSMNEMHALAVSLWGLRLVVGFYFPPFKVLCLYTHKSLTT